MATFSQQMTVLLTVLLMLPALVGATVEVGRDPAAASTLEDVYVIEGVPYLPIDDVLAALEVQGEWDSVAHLYRIATPSGEVEFFPGGRYLRRGGRFQPLPHPARFIDGRLRVPEGFVTTILPSLVEVPVHYRNFDPPRQVAKQDEGAVDRLFSFILRRKAPSGGPALRAVALDPGHGGQDPGVLGPGGLKEKEIVLAVAQRLEKQLKMQLGIPVYMSRDGDYEVSFPERLAPAAREDVDAFLSLHAQGPFSPGHRGITLFVRPEDALAEGEAILDASRQRESLRLAHSLLAALKRSGFRVNGIHETPLLPLGQGNLPTVLVELGYLSNDQDRTDLTSPDVQERLSRSLFQGLKTFAELGKELRP